MTDRSAVFSEMNIDDHQKYTHPLIGGLASIADQVIGEGAWEYATAVYIDHRLTDGRDIVYSGLGGTRRLTADVDPGDRAVDFTTQAGADPEKLDAMEYLVHSWEQSFDTDNPATDPGPFQILVIDITRHFTATGAVARTDFFVAPIWREAHELAGRPPFDDLVLTLTQGGQTVDWPAAHRIIAGRAR